MSAPPDAVSPEALDVLARLRSLMEVTDALRTLNLAHSLVTPDPARAARRIAEAIAALETTIPQLSSGLSHLARALTPDEDAPSARPHRVLVCEDDASVRLLLTALLDGDERFELVAAVPDAETALAQTAATRPDVVLLDLAMPGMGGLAAIRPILEQAPECRVIVWSGTDRPQAAEQALREGAAAIVFKAAGVDGLLGELAAIMQSSRPAESSPEADVIDLRTWAASRAPFLP